MDFKFLGSGIRDWVLWSRVKGLGQGMGFRVQDVR